MQSLLPITVASTVIHVLLQQMPKKCVSNYATLIDLKMRTPFQNSAYSGKLQLGNLLPLVSLWKNNGHTCLTSETSALLSCSQKHSLGGKDPLNSHWLAIHATAVHISTGIRPPQSIVMSAHFFTLEHKNCALLSINRTFKNILHESTFKWRLELQKHKWLPLPLKLPKVINAWIRKLFILLP